MQWTIDTFLDGRSGYFFETNPSGAMADALLGINGQNRQWDGIWNERAHRTATGWTLRDRNPVPHAELQPEQRHVGHQLSRTLSRKNENSIWMGWARNQGLQRMTNAGLVTGLTDVTQGHGLDIKPYGLARAGRARAEADRRWGRPGRRRSLLQPDAGAPHEPDAQHRLRADRGGPAPGQPHALSRCFYPEKRDFFLDGATFFDFASPAGRRGNNSQNTFDTDRLLSRFSAAASA